MTISSRASFAFLALLAACSDPTGIHRNPPPPYQKPPDVNVILIAAVSPTEIIAKPGSDVGTRPSVRVYNTTVSNPVAGATVLFRIMNPDGTTTQTVSVKTSSDGIATLPSWRLGEALGRYWTVATVEGSNAVDFFAYVRGNVVGIYDLVGFEDATFPSHFISEAHYILFEDGSYNHVYNYQITENTIFDSVDGVYTKDSAGVFVFYLNRPSSFFGNILSEARPVNGKLRVTYSDFVDFDIEYYVLRK